ncbi:MAG TPA: hypothetical protein VGC79_11805 [Polyangiaceae bacterium]
MRRAVFGQATGPRALVLLNGFAALLTVSGRASAANCSDLPNRVYLAAPDTQEKTIKTLARQLRDSSTKPLTLVYQTSSAPCSNVALIADGTPATTAFNFVPSTADDPSWTPAQASISCAPDAGGNKFDLVATDLFLATCRSSALPATLTVTKGPVRPYVFATSLASEQRAITAEQAYFVFGFPNGGQASPWVDEANLFIRSPTNSILRALAANIRVPENLWRGISLNSSNAVVAALSGASNPQTALGVLDAFTYDANRTTLRALAFRAWQQRHAYYPDSTFAKNDRQNVRDGHYLLWSQGSYIAVSAQANAVYVANLLAGASVSPAPDFEPLDAVATSGSIPDCAMTVSRSVEGGNLSTYTPAASCACYYENWVSGASSCQACSGASPCASGSCRRGLCEVK